MRGGCEHRFIQLRGGGTEGSPFCCLLHQDVDVVEWEVLFFMVFGDRLQGEGWKLYQEKFKQDLKKKSYWKYEQSEKAPR